MLQKFQQLVFQKSLSKANFIALLGALFASFFINNLHFRESWCMNFPVIVLSMKLVYIFFQCIFQPFCL